MKYSVPSPKLNYGIVSSLIRDCLLQKAPKVIHVALNASYEPLALFVVNRVISLVMPLASLNVVVIYLFIPVKEKLLATLTGYTLTRGVLCAMRRRALPSVEEVCRKARRIVVIEGRGRRY